MNDATWYDKPILVDHFPIALTPEAWIAMLPTVVSQLSAAERQAFASRLFVTLQGAGVDVEEYLDFVIEGLCEYKAK